METLQQIANRILAAKEVLILTHIRPDGDAYGSALALACALKRRERRVQVCVDGDCPSNLTFVKGTERVKKRPKTGYDLVVAVDCSDDARLGGLQEVFLSAKRQRMDTVNVDHHISNPRYAKYNFVRTCSANCMNIAKLISYMGVSFDREIAEYLMLGLLTDSGNFSHDDVNEEAFLLAAALVKTGMDLCALEYELFKKQPKARAKLFAKATSCMRYFHDDRFALLLLTKQMLADCGADEGMTEGFVDFPLTVDGVEVSASVMEVRKGQYKISVRTKSYADARRIAETYGGGGHIRASGFMLFGEAEEVVDKLSYTVSQYLE